MEVLMSEMVVFAQPSLKVQFRTTRPTEGDERLQRQREFAELLNQLRNVVKEGMAECRLPGWEVVVTEASY
jgi:hypothetical protein